MVIALVRKFLVLLFLCLLSREDLCPTWFLSIWVSLHILSISLVAFYRFKLNVKNSWWTDGATWVAGFLLYALDPGAILLNVTYSILLVFYLKDAIAIYSYLKTLLIAEIYS